MLWPLSLLGVVGFGIMMYDVAADGADEVARAFRLIYCVCLGIWSSVFLKYLRRGQRRSALRWGAIGATHRTKPRPEFHGLTRISECEGKMKLSDDGSQRGRWEGEEEVYEPHRCNQLFFSTSLLVTMLSAVVASLIGIFVLRAFLREYIGFSSFILAGSINAAQIAIMNTMYTQVARILTDWENWRFQEQFENSLTVSLWNGKRCHLNVTQK